jgi:hypothetical protein
MRKIALVVIALVASLNLHADILDLSDSKNDVSSNLLTQRFFESMGLDVISKSDETFGLRAGGYNILLYPQTTKDNGDLIVATIMFKGVGKSNSSSDALQMLLGKANHEFNYLTCYVEDDGDIIVRYTLLFDKKLEPKTVNKWLRRIEVQTDTFIKDFGDRVRPYIKE